MPGDRDRVKKQGWLDLILNWTFLRVGTVVREGPTASFLHKPEARPEDPRAAPKEFVC